MPGLALPVLQGGCVGSDTHFSMKNENLGSGMEIARVDERAAPKNH